MKTIIKKSTKTPPDEFLYIKKCQVCKCVFTYELNDVYGIDSDMISCPSCKYINIILINHKYKQKEGIKDE